jgi:hypothetical protein
MLLVWLKLWLDEENGWLSHSFIFGLESARLCSKCSSSAGIYRSPRRWVVTDERLLWFLMAARLNHRKNLSDKESKEQSNNVLSCEEARKPYVLVG